MNHGNRVIGYGSTLEGCKERAHFLGLRRCCSRCHPGVLSPKLAGGDPQAQAALDFVHLPLKFLIGEHRLQVAEVDPG